MASVLVQAGHYPHGGGAPGEASWTMLLAEKVARRLRSSGVSVVIVGDWYGQPSPPETNRDYDLFVSLHYDAAVYAGRDALGNTGCFADRGRLDPAGAQADRAIREWERRYPARYEFR